MPNPGLARPALVGVTVWRLVVATCGFVGFGAAVAAMDDPWSALSQQASLFTGVVYLGLALYPFLAGAPEPRSPWLRGATCVLLLLVAGTYMSLMEGDLGSVHSLFEHLLTPLVVLVDWVLVGRNQAAVRWWHPLSWLVFPLAYLVYFMVDRPLLYRGFLNPDSGDFPGMVAAFTVAVLAAGFVLYGIAKTRAQAQPVLQGGQP
jgi:hypothetical protein